MRWESGRKSSNIEDQRGRRIPGGFKGGGIGIILLALVAMYFGIDPSIILNLGGEMEGERTSTSADYQPTAEENQLAEFVSVVLADTEDIWILPQFPCHIIAPRAHPTDRLPADNHQ